MFARFAILSFVITFVNTASTRDDMGLRNVMRIYEECNRSDGFAPCLKKKAILFFDRAARMDSIPVLDWVEVVKTSESEVVAVSEKDMEASLPRNIKDKDEALTDMLWDRVASFANSRTLQLSLPKMSGQDLNKGVEEGKSLFTYSILPLILLFIDYVS